MPRRCFKNVGPGPLHTSMAAEAVQEDLIPELIVKEGEDIDYRVVLGAYLLADLSEFLGLVSMIFIVVFVRN